MNFAQSILGKTRPEMISLENIERSYKTGAGQTWVLRRINLKIEAGEFITIMGPSGAGKSSLLNVLALARRPMGRVLLVQWRSSPLHEPQAEVGAGQAQHRHGFSELPPAR